MMVDYVPLSDGSDRGREEATERPKERTAGRGATTRLASLDAFRGLSIALMVFVDYAGSIFSFVAHSPWNGLRLADFVTPFFLFIAGISLSIVHKKIPNKFQATQKAFLRALKLFMLGLLLQGGYFHGVNSLTFGVDVEKIRWLGILQRIAIGYMVAALCEIWSSSIISKDVRGGLFRNYCLHWIVIFLLSGIYLGMLYGLYVPDWSYNMQLTTSSNSSFESSYAMKMVTCKVRGDLGPGCNSAGMIDRYVLGIEHLYRKPAYRNLKECQMSSNTHVPDKVPSWCEAPFDPEGILGSLMASITCIIGLHFGHAVVLIEDHKHRLFHWLLFSLSTFSLGLFLNFVGIPLNKQLYTVSYMLLTAGSAGFTFSALYILVDVTGCRWLTFVLEWMGRHSLSIFILVASNVAVIVIQGFYWRNPENNIVQKSVRCQICLLREEGVLAAVDLIVWHQVFQIAQSWAAIMADRMPKVHWIISRVIHK